jgi:hypothetical protein
MASFILGGILIGGLIVVVVYLKHHINALADLKEVVIDLERKITKR